MTFDQAPEKTRYERRRERRHERYGMLGPILLVAIGVMFLVGQFYPTWGVAKTWPVLLIVIGVAKLLDSAYSGRSMPPN
ncbi:MAG: DUF5668 domain-containing protein [Acidobacteriota bacterium]